MLSWPPAPGERSREVWYSLVSPRDGTAALWSRYTLLSTGRGRREGRLWVAYTDRESPEDSTFVTESFAPEDVRPAGDPFQLTVGDAVLTSAGATGEVGDVSWDLAYEPDTYAFTPLRSETLTDVLARTVDTGRHWSRNQSVSMSGEVTVGDRTLALEDAPGHQGHTVSAAPPESWSWVQCNDFAEEDAAVLEALRLGRALTICLRIDGEIYPLNRLKYVVPYGPSANRTDHDEPGHWRFRGAGEGIELQATVEADPDHWHRVAYLLPDDSLRYNAHCSLSRLTLTYRRNGEDARTITSDAARAEWVDVDPPVGGPYRPSWD